MDAMNKIKIFLLASAALLMQSSCSKDDGIEASEPICQEYYLIRTANGYWGCANFREGSIAGKRIELPKGAWLEVSGSLVEFKPSVSQTEPEFNYESYAIPSGEIYAVFLFQKNKEQRFVNSIKLQEVALPDISVGIEKIANNTTVTQAGLDKYDGDLRIYLTDNDLLDGTQYEASIDRRGGTYTFSGVPQGTYVLTYEISKKYPLTAPDGNAGGSITTIGRGAKAISVI